MTPRERMRRLYDGLPVDRIPNGLGGCETAGMHVLAYENFKEILGVTDPTNRLYTFMANSVFEPSVLEAMDGDLIILNSGMCASPLWGEGRAGTWKDQVLWGRTFQVPVPWQFRMDDDGTVWWGERRKCPPGGIYFDTVPRPPAPPGQPAPPPSPDDQPSPDDFEPSHELPEETLRRLEDAARWLHENTDYSIVVGETIQDLQLRPGGREAWWTRLVTEPDACRVFLAKAAEAGLSHLRQVDQAVGKYCDAVIIADDMGDRRGVTIGPETWREVYKPCYARLWTGWKGITHMKSMLHCCGSVVDILPDFVECGLDVFNPLQISARGMEPENLVREVGGRIIFHGGALDAVVTPPGTPDEVVYETAKKTITTFARGGGYIFAGTHNIPGDTPPGHLRAMLQAWRDCRDTGCAGGAGPPPGGSPSA